MKTILAVLFTILLTACATDYKTYSDAVASVESAKHQAEGEKYKALAAIASSGSDVARVAAVMAMQNMGAQAPAQGTTLRPPESGFEMFMRGLTSTANIALQAYGIRTNSQLGMRQSDNAASIAASTNATMLGIASHIQAPAPAAMPQANVTTTTTTNANVSNVDSHAIADSFNQKTRDSGNTTTTNTPTSIADSYNTATTSDSGNSTVATTTTTTTNTTTTNTPVSTNTTTDSSTKGNTTTTTTVPPVTP